MKRNKIPELVLPGGDFHRVKIAFLYGADAVYLGLDKHSLRKAEVNFTIRKIKEAISYAHKEGKKAYVTFNIFAHERHLSTIKKDMQEIAKAKPDAFIISDTGLISMAKKHAKNIPIHLSTQANTVNSEAVKFWKNMGIKRVVLGREVTLNEIKKIKKAVPKMELEVFVHGAMCISYSGRCLMSAAMTKRSANLGKCSQPCRFNYKVYLEEAKRPGEYFRLDEDEHGSYIMNSKDLCLIEHLDKLVPYVDALKIEGRNKTDYYVATAAKTYHEALKLIREGKYTAKEKKRLKNELEALTRRGYTTGFLLGDAKSGETFSTREPILGKRYLGYIKEADNDGTAKVIVKNKLEIGKTYEILTPKEVYKFKIIRMRDGNKKEIKVANPGRKKETVYLSSDTKMFAPGFIRAAK